MEDEVRSENCDCGTSIDHTDAAQTPLKKTSRAHETDVSPPCRSSGALHFMGDLILQDFTIPKLKDQVVQLQEELRQERLLNNELKYEIERSSLSNLKKQLQGKELESDEQKTEIEVLQQEKYNFIKHLENLAQVVQQKEEKIASLETRISGMSRSTASNQNDEKTMGVLGIVEKNEQEISQLKIELINRNQNLGLLQDNLIAYDNDVRKNNEIIQFCLNAILRMNHLGNQNGPPESQSTRIDALELRLLQTEKCLKGLYSEQKFGNRKSVANAFAEFQHVKKSMHKMNYGKYENIEKNEKNTNELLILGDSILKHVNVMGKDTQVTKMYMPGLKIEDTAKVWINYNKQKGKIPDVTIIHVGTNNITTFQRHITNKNMIKDEYRKMITEIKMQNANSKIVMSVLLRRSDVNREDINDVNEDLHKIAIEQKIHFVDPNSWLDDFCFARDGLYTNKKGSVRLSALFSRLQSRILCTKNGNCSSNVTLNNAGENENFANGHSRVR